MAQSTVATANEVTHFQKKVNREYVRGGKFKAYIGAGENSVIQTNQDLKKRSIPLIAKVGGGVTGTSTLSGNESSLANYEMPFTPSYDRNAVKVNDEDNEKSEFSLFNEANPALKDWSMELKRNKIIQALGAITVAASGAALNYGGTKGAFGSTAASAGNMDTWNTNNQDRVLYGKLKSNNSPGNHTTSLANIDTTDDKMTAKMVTLLKRMAGLANPLIRPIMVRDDEPWYVLFLGSFSFRDLNEDSTITQANREARARGVNTGNPIFEGGDLLYNGVIIREIPEIDSLFIDGDGLGGDYDGVWGANAASTDGLDNGGSGGSRVGIGFLCGAQAVCFGRGRDAQMTRDKNDDYGFNKGVGIQMKHDFKKFHYNLKQHGMVTTFHSAAADA